MLRLYCLFVQANFSEANLLARGTTLELRILKTNCTCKLRKDLKNSFKTLNLPPNGLELSCVKRLAR